MHKPCALPEAMTTTRTPMKQASHHEATPGTPAEAQGIVTPQRAHAFAAGLALEFELTPFVAPPRGGVTHTVQKFRPRRRAALHGQTARRHSRTSELQVYEQQIGMHVGKQ